MSVPLFLSCLWVIAGTGVAMLPMRLQYAPGLALLLVAPVLLGWLGATYGGWVVAVAGLAVLSMFRRPLFYLARRGLRRGRA
jgi:hypothetical protein